MRHPQDTQSPLRPSTIISGQVLAAEDGGDDEPPDLPDGLFDEDGDNDEELHQPQENEEIVSLTANQLRTRSASLSWSSGIRRASHQGQKPGVENPDSGV